MPLRQSVNLTDKASTNPVVSGAALTAELSNMAYPESGDKRFMLDMFPINRGASTGATPIELFISGLANFRFRPADQSTVFVKAFATYTSSVGANDTAFEITLGMTNRAGTVIILPNSTNVKMPTAGLPTLNPTVVGGNLVMTATGVAGDTNGRWSCRLIIDEVTDIG